MTTRTRTRKRKKTANGSRRQPMPVFPPANDQGYYPAAETLQVIIARQLIERRRKAGLSQAEVAKRAGIRQETASRLERILGAGRRRAGNNNALLGVFMDFYQRGVRGANGLLQNVDN